MAGDEPFSPEDLAEIKGALGGAPEAEDAAALGPGDVAAMKDALAGKPQAAAEPAAKPVRAPTRYQKAATVAPEEPELTWAETGRQAVKNLPESAKGTVQAMGHAVLHPIETGKTVYQLGKGLGSQIGGVFGLGNDSPDKAKVESLAKAVEEHYKTSYGSVKGFKKAVATDPVSVALDASTLLGGTGSAAKIAGLEKTAATLGKASSLIDPIQQSVNVAKKVGSVAAKPVAAVARHAASVTTGVPPSLMKVATEAGATSDPALRSAFLRFAKGEGRAEEFLQTAQNALDAVRGEASDAYLAGKKALQNANPSFAPIEDAIKAARNETMKGGLRLGQFKEANAALDETENLVQAWKAATDPSYRDLFGFDNLKQAIWDVRDSYGNSAAKKHLGGVYNGVKKAILDVDPAYAQLMENYQTARNNIVDLQKTVVGAGANPAATATMAKGLRVLKTGSGKNLFTQLAEKEPTLPFMLAGHAMEPWMAGGMRGVLEGPAAIALAALVHPAAAVGQVMTQSPKLVGAANYGAGMIGRGLDKVGPALTGATYAGRIGQEGEATSTVPDGAPLRATPEEIDSATRMVLGEAGGEPDAGKAAAIHTAINRAKLSGKALGDVISEPNAFEPVTSGKTAEFDPNSPEYQHVRDQIVVPALAGKLPDPTAGATYFINLDLQKQLGRKVPKWAQRDGLKIGNHTFYGPEEAGRQGFASGGGVKEPDIEPLVSRLMTQAKQARKAGTKATEPLLNSSDDSVAAALAVANRAI